MFYHQPIKITTSIKKELTKLCQRKGLTLSIISDRVYINGEEYNLKLVNDEYVLKSGSLSNTLKLKLSGMQNYEPRFK